MSGFLQAPKPPEPVVIRPVDVEPDLEAVASRIDAQNRRRANRDSLRIDPAIGETPGGEGLRIQ